MIFFHWGYNSGVECSLRMREAASSILAISIFFSLMGYTNNKYFAKVTLRITFSADGSGIEECHSVLNLKPVINYRRLQTSTHSQQLPRCIAHRR